MGRLTSFLLTEDQQYLPFAAAAVLFGVVVGFPLGLTVAHAGAQSSTLGGHVTSLAQVHGHLQLSGWLGLFAMGMGFRLVQRFTSYRVKPVWLAPLALVLVVSGLVLRALTQPLADAAPFAVLFALSAMLEAAGVLIFTGAILRAVLGGRSEGFLYSPFFAAGAVWATVAAFLNLAFVIDAAVSQETTIAALRSLGLSSVQIYGFVTMFILAVSLRVFPIFFERPPAPRQATIVVWALLNLAIAAYAASVLWQDSSLNDATRLLQNVSYALLGLLLAGVVALLRVFKGQPHRMRASAQRTMWFVRAGYFWLFIAAVLQVSFAVRAEVDGRFLAYYEMDAVRHFLAVGFMTTMVIGMAFMVLPRLAMRRVETALGRTGSLAFLILLQSATIGRGVGSLIANEGHFTDGFWWMTAGGTFAVVVMLVFTGFLLRQPKIPEIGVSQVQMRR